MCVYNYYDVTCSDYFNRIIREDVLFSMHFLAINYQYSLLIAFIIMSTILIRRMGISRVCAIPGYIIIIMMLKYWYTKKSDLLSVLRYLNNLLQSVMNIAVPIL
jgi:hypothetical protein